jgi:hypothetical protein
VLPNGNAVNGHVVTVIVTRSNRRIIFDPQLGKAWKLLPGEQNLPEELQKYLIRPETYKLIPGN